MSYRSCFRSWLACIDARECVWWAFRKKAWQGWELALKLQQVLFLCSSMVILSLWRYWRWKARVLAQLGCLECVQNICLRVLLLRWKLCLVMPYFLHFKQPKAKLVFRQVEAPITCCKPWHWSVWLVPKLVPRGFDLYFLDIHFDIKLTFAKMVKVLYLFWD